ncbi:MAG: DUF4440 domain-containing protein [Bacteroidota bacterium]
MKSAVLATLCCFYFGFLGAQKISDPALHSLVEAEWAFINMAKEKNTRDAFMYFLADDAVTFGPGLRIGKKYLEAQKPNDSWLKWEPTYSDIAGSGDFGFNTGPWEFRAKKTDEKAVAFGHFITVWKKQTNGEWKALIDIGVSHPQPENTPALTTSSKPLERSAGKSPVTFNDILEEEKKFINSYVEKGIQAYETLTSTEARFYRQNKFPSTGPYLELVSSVGGKIVYTPVNGAAASSGDMAFVYGTVKIETTENGATLSKDGNYMRIWKKENSGHWKIVLDVLN